MPTLREMAGVTPPAQSHGLPAQPLQGHSQWPVLREACAAAVRQEQYCECWSNRAYYRDGWVAVAIQKLGTGIDFDNWTLHRQDSDFSESLDLAAEQPQLLQALVDAFDREAWEHKVYPLDNRNMVQKFQQLAPHQQPPAQGRRRFLPGVPCP